MFQQTHARAHSLTPRLAGLVNKQTFTITYVRLCTQKMNKDIHQRAKHHLASMIIFCT